MKYKTINWLELDQYVTKLAEKIKKERIGYFTGVYGLPRGGLVPAVMLSHRLNLPLLMAPCEGCLVVDDIADTGTTLQHYREKGWEIAVIWYKPQSKVVPDFYAVKETRKKMGWIVFPWEVPPKE